MLPKLNLQFNIDMYDIAVWLGTGNGGGRELTAELTKEENGAETKRRQHGPVNMGLCFYLCRGFSDNLRIRQRKPPATQAILYAKAHSLLPLSYALAKIWVL